MRVSTPTLMSTPAPLSKNAEITTTRMADNPDWQEWFGWTDTRGVMIASAVIFVMLPALFALYLLCQFPAQGRDRPGDEIDTENWPSGEG